MKALTLRDPTLLGILGKVEAPDAANLRLWLDGDDTDGIRNGTLTAGQKLTSWKNKGSIGGEFIQANANIAPVFTRTSGVGSGGGAVFTGTQWMKSNAAASAFTFLHDGTGCTIYAVAKSTIDEIGVLISTSTNVTEGAGMGLRRQEQGLLRPNMYVLNSVGGIIANVTPNPNSYLINQYDMLTAVYALSLPADLSLFVNSTNVSNDNVGATPSTLAPASAAVIGATPAGDINFRGTQWQTMAFASVHDATMRAEVLAFMQEMAKANFPVVIAP